MIEIEKSGHYIIYMVPLRSTYQTLQTERDHDEIINRW